MIFFLLNGGDTGHLHRGLQSTTQEESSEGGSVREQLRIRLGLVFVFIRDALLDLSIFGLDPRVLLVAMCMELRQSP